MPRADHRASSPPDLTSQPLRFLSAYWTLWQTLSHQLNVELTREVHLDLRSFIALSYIQSGRTTPGELARTLGIPKYEMTRILNQLTRLHAITRHTNPLNGRYRSVTATLAGRTLWEDALRIVQERTAPPLLDLGPNLDPLTVTLERLAHSAAQHANDLTTQEHA